MSLDFDIGQDEKVLEELARDIMLLSRTVGVYPRNHPHVTSLMERLADWADQAGPKGLSFGVTASELVVNGTFHGGKNTRVAMLARYLHRKKIARIHWRKGMENDEIYSFATTLGDKKLNGEAIPQKLEELGVENIIVTHLDLNALHDRMRLDEGPSGGGDNKERRERIWRWLQEAAGNPKKVGEALSSEEFWKNFESDDEELRDQFVDTLVALGAMMDRSLHTVSAPVRDKIGQRLANMGKGLDSNNLARMVNVLISSDTPTEQSLQALMRYVDGDRLVGVMGGLVDMGEGKEERVARFVDKFVPPESMMGLTGLIHEWKGSGEKMGYASEVWEWLESFLLNIDENEYMGEGYRETLDRMASKLTGSAGAGLAFGFFQDPQVHVDLIFAGLKLEKVEGADELLQKRINSRLNELDGVGMMDFIEMLEKIVPEDIKEQLPLFEKVFNQLIDESKDISKDVRKRLILLARRNQQLVLDFLVKRLLDEERISGRKLIVEILSNMTSEVVPQLVQRARTGPWYLIRNMAIVLGSLKDIRATPFLKSLLDHENDRVRKEALRGLSQLGKSAREILIDFSMNMDKSSGERKAAKSYVKRMGLE